MLNNKATIVLDKVGPLWKKSQYRDTKDPCPVFDGKVWHIFGSGGAILGDRPEEWEILHATAPSINGPWKEMSSAKINGLAGKHIAAPGVVYESGRFHMLVQTEFLDVGGTIEYLVSDDGGESFVRQETALSSIKDSHEAALYDPHQAIINGKKYFTYSASNFIGTSNSADKNGAGPWVGRPDIYLAASESNTWAGPWKRLGKILDHEDVVHHNQRDHMSYEWGLEGSQLIQLPNGIIILNAVCFLPHGEYGTRQRIFFAFADNIMGPYFTAGTVLKPVNNSWEGAENGHAAAFMYGPDMILFYQGRPPNLEPWRYGIAYFNIKMLERIGKSTIKYNKRLSEITKEPKNTEFEKLSRNLRYSKTILTMTEYRRELRTAWRKYLKK